MIENKKLHNLHESIKEVLSEGGFENHAAGKPFTHHEEEFHDMLNSARGADGKPSKVDHSVEFGDHMNSKPDGVSHAKHANNYFKSAVANGSLHPNDAPKIHRVRFNSYDEASYTVTHHPESALR